MNENKAVSLINPETGEYVAAGELSLPEIEDQLGVLFAQRKKDNWEIGRYLSEARIILKNNNDFGAWCTRSAIIAEQSDRSLLNFRRLWEVFSERQEEVKAIPQTGLYELAATQLDEVREDIIGTLLESGPEKVSVKEVQEACAPYISTGSKHVSQKNNDWYTPEEYLAAAREVMGSIDLDPASSDTAQAIVQAKSYHTIDNSGLTVPWAGKVWLNPPYSATEIQQFIKKLLLHWEEGDISEAIVLTNNSTDTTWFHDLLDSVSRVCFTKGRIGFIDISGEQQLQARQGQAFFYIGSKSDKFSAVFSQFGKVLCHDD